MALFVGIACCLHLLEVNSALSQLTQLQGVNELSTIARIGKYSLPEELLEVRILSPISGSTYKKATSVRLDWVLLPGVTRLTVAPHSTIEYVHLIQLHLSSYSAKTFKLASGQSLTFNLSKKPAENGPNELKMEGRVTAGEKTITLFVAQERVTFIDRSGKVIDSWLTNNLRSVRLVRR